MKSSDTGADAHAASLRSPSILIGSVVRTAFIDRGRFD
jgi:hypothetical protein